MSKRYLHGYERPWTDGDDPAQVAGFRRPHRPHPDRWTIGARWWLAALLVGAASWVAVIAVLLAAIRWLW